MLFLKGFCAVMKANARDFFGLAFAIQIKHVVNSITHNPVISLLWIVAIYACSRAAELILFDAGASINRGKYHQILAASDVVNLTLTSGLYCVISVCAAGFALVLTSLKNATRVLSDNLSSDGIDIELPIILEEKRLERQARAAEKRFNDGDTTAAEYRAAIAQIETRRWQLRMAAASNP